MRTITKEELTKILERHKEWLADNSKGERADLSSADLLNFQYQRHVAYFTRADGMLRIGCHFMPVSEWLIGYEELGRADGYTDEELKVYGAFIKQCAEMVR